MPSILRFCHIYKLFFTFATRYLTERGLLAQPGLDGDGWAGNDDAEAILFEAVWGEGGHLEVIDAFVNDPQVPLDSADKDVVRGWREGIYDSFSVISLGSDVVFLYGTYNFCVCGLDDEIDEVMDCLPASISTVIVPFDGIITLLPYMTARVSQLPDSLNLDAMLSEWEQHIRDHGLIIRSARQFEEVAADARAAMERSKEEARVCDESASHAGDIHVDEHRGELAGLSWEERTRRVDEAVKDVLGLGNGSYALSLIDSECLRGTPQDSEVDTIGSYGLMKLRFLAAACGAVGMLTREELIDFFMARMLPDAEKTLRDLRMTGTAMLRSMHMMVEANGRVHVKADGTTPEDDIPYPYFPWVAYYREPGGYVAASPREILCALEGTDWDAEYARTERLDQALCWLDTAVDMRGVIEVDEALRALVERFPGIDSAEVKEVVRRRLQPSVTYIRIDTVYGQEYFVAADLYQPQENLPVSVQVHEILSAREGIPPYWPTEAEAGLGAIVMSMGQPEVRPLIQYLDEHVPDDEDDLLYANNSWTKLFGMVRMYEDVESVIKSFVADHAYTEAQFNRLSELVPPTIITIPMRRLNGHSVKRYYNEVVPDKKPNGFKG